MDLQGVDGVDVLGLHLILHLCRCERTDPSERAERQVDDAPCPAAIVAPLRDSVFLYVTLFF